jgi:sirohydrochlorin cobaltochelatase
MAVVMAVGAFATLGISTASAAAKQAIVVVSFGTTFDDSRKSCIESVENKVRSEFPDYEVRRAFTSRIVMSRLAKRGIYADTLEQALDKLKAEGYTDVIVQSTHLTTGEEFEKKIVAPVAEYAKDFASLKVGRPILTTYEDLYVAVDALKQQLPEEKKGQEIVFMGHGSPHQHNPAYQALQNTFDAEKLPVTIGVVEETDHPSQDDVVARLAAKKGVKSVVLMPLMLVAGDHANNDMAGDEEDSWKSVLTEKGYKVSSYIHGLGENEAIQAIYVQHIKDAIAGK